MRRNLVFLLSFVLLLAACNGNNAPAPTANSAVQQNPATIAPTVDNSTATPIPTEVQREYSTEEAGPLPIPGTLVAAATEDPDAGKVFDTLTFTRTGGIAAQPITITLAGNGNMTRNGVASTISPDQVTQLVSAIDKLNFFGLDGVFTAPGTSADAYHYQIMVERNGTSRTINVEDGFIPPEMVPLLGLLTALGT